MADVFLPILLSAGATGLITFIGNAMWFAHRYGGLETSVNELRGALKSQEARFDREIEGVEASCRERNAALNQNVKDRLDTMSQDLRDVKNLLMRERV